MPSYQVLNGRRFLCLPAHKDASPSQPSLWVPWFSSSEAVKLQPQSFVSRGRALERRGACRRHLVGQRPAGLQPPACPAAGRCGAAGLQPPGLQPPACPAAGAASRWRRPGVARARTRTRTQTAAARRRRGSGRRPGTAPSRRRWERSRGAVRAGGGWATLTRRGGGAQGGGELKGLPQPGRWEASLCPPEGFLQPLCLEEG